MSGEAHGPHLQCRGASSDLGPGGTRVCPGPGPHSLPPLGFLFPIPLGSSLSLSSFPSLCSKSSCDGISHGGEAPVPTPR